MTETNKINSIKQKNTGKNQKIAGNNYIEVNGDGFTPDQDNPELTTCYCGWPGLHKLADKCPKCGYNHLVERMEKQALLEEQNKAFISKVSVVLLLIFISALQITINTNFTFFDSLAISVFMASILYYGAIWIYSYYTVRLKYRNLYK